MHRGVAIAIACCMTVAVVAQSSPTASMRAYYQAARTKDFAALKALLSAEYLKELAKAPVAPERIMEGLTEIVPPTMPEIRNEKVDGDRATLEVLDHRSKRWETIRFVKQNGAWKLALHEMK